MANDTGYCVKCKSKKLFSTPQHVKTKNGRSAIKGMCRSCGTKMYKFIKSK